MHQHVQLHQCEQHFEEHCSETNISHDDIYITTRKGCWAMGHVDFQGNMECGETDSPVASTITPVPVQVISSLSSSTKGK